MTERQAKLQKLRTQSNQYAARLERRPRPQRVEALPNADQIVKDPTGVRALRLLGGARD